VEELTLKIIFLNLNERSRALLLDLIKHSTCLSLLLARLGGVLMSLNHYLGGVFCILDKIKGPKVVLSGEICIQGLV